MAKTKEEKPMEVEIIGKDGAEAVVPAPAPKKKRYQPPRPDKQFNEDGSRNRCYIKNAMAMWDWTTPDMDDLDAVQKRIMDYFQLCDETEVRPSVEGLAFAFGVCRRTLLNWIYGTVKSRKRALPLLKRAYDILSLQMANYMQDGKINPVTGIFLMTNNQGYLNRAELAVRPENPLDEHPETPELQQKYADDTFNALDDDASDSDSDT